LVSATDASYAVANGESPARYYSSPTRCRPPDPTTHSRWRIQTTPVRSRQKWRTDPGGARFATVRQNGAACPASRDRSHTMGTQTCFDPAGWAAKLRGSPREEERSE